MSSHLPSANTPPQSQNDRLLASSSSAATGVTAPAGSRPVPLDTNADLPMPVSPRGGSINSLTPHLAAPLCWATLTHSESSGVAAVLWMSWVGFPSIHRAALHSTLAEHSLAHTHPDELRISRRRRCAVNLLGQFSKHSQCRSLLHARSADPNSSGSACQQHPDSSSSLAPATSPLHRRRHLSKRPLQSSWRASGPGFRCF
jgi:hypothetical protein